MTYRFLGIEAEIGPRRLDRFGQAIELPEAEGSAAIIANRPILPDADFSRCGFSLQELDEFAYPAARGKRPDDPQAAARYDAFCGKWKTARVALHEVREHLRSGITPGAGAPAEKDGE